MDKNVRELLNDQVNKEFFSAYLYLEISNFYADKNLNGYANWYLIQAQEERDHAMLFLKFLQNNGEKINLKAIDAPSKNYKDDFLQPLKDSYAHEVYVTNSINAIYAQAQKDNDYRTMEFLNWFIKEQGEEEKNADELVRRYELFGKDSKGLYMLDAEYASRVYSAPSLILD